MHTRLKILLASNYLNMFGYGLFGPLYAMFVLNVGGAEFHAGATWALYSLVSGILMLLFGRIENKTSKSSMVVLGYFFLAIGAFSYLFVQNILHLYAVQIFNAIGVGILNPGWKALYASFEDEGKESEEWAFFDGGNRILLAAASFAGGWLVSMYGFEVLFILMSAFQMMGAVLSLRLELTVPQGN